MTGRRSLDPTAAVLTTKGDLLGYSTVPARVPVGSDGSVVTADSTNALGVSYKSPAFITGSGLSSIFVVGDGIDGVLTLDGTNTYSILTKSGNIYKLTKDTYASTLTLVAPATLVTNGFKLYWQALDLSNCAVGAINYNGTNGNSGAITVAGAGVTGLSNNTVGGGPQALAGQNGGTAAGTLGQVAGAALLSYGGGNNRASQTSGLGGAGSSGAGGGNHIGTTGTVPNPVRIYQQQLFHYAVNTSTSSIMQGGCSGASGGSGGGDGTAGGGSGSGSLGGGVVYLMGGTLITSASTPAGAIQARGGTAGNGGTPAGGNRGGGGAGMGGGGGWIYFGYFTRIGPAVTNLIDASGGNGGVGGSGTGTGVNGSGGGGGDSGRVQLFAFTTNTMTETIGAAGTVGGGVGVTTAGIGGACLVTL